MDDEQGKEFEDRAKHLKDWPPTYAHQQQSWLQTAILLIIAILLDIRKEVRK